METHFGQHVRMLAWSEREWQIAIGSLLGDATLSKTTSGYCFRVHHGLAQAALVDWKYAQLRRFVRTPPRVSGRAYYFRTVTHPRLAELRAAFYRAGRKRVPMDVLSANLTPLALAVWIMDDGAADGRQLRLNTQSFRADECELLASLLYKNFGVVFTLNFDKGMPRLRCRSDSMERLRTLVHPHVLPEMRYKIGGFSAPRVVAPSGDG